MPSRFDMALGKKGPEKKVETEQVIRPAPGAEQLSPFVNSFMSHLKLVNELNGVEISLQYSNISMSMETPMDHPGPPMMQISLSVTCPMEEGRQLMSGDRVRRSDVDNINIYSQIRGD